MRPKPKTQKVIVLLNSWLDHLQVFIISNLAPHIGTSACQLPWNRPRIIPSEFRQVSKRRQPYWRVRSTLLCRRRRPAALYSDVSRGKVRSLTELRNTPDRPGCWTYYVELTCTQHWVPQLWNYGISWWDTVAKHTPQWTLMRRCHFQRCSIRVLPLANTSDNVASLYASQFSLVNKLALSSSSLGYGEIYPGPPSS
jgi:hypothetical protein